MGDGFELPILVFFPVWHDRTPSYVKHVRIIGRWVAEISCVILEVVHADVVPLAVSEGGQRRLSSGQDARVLVAVGTLIFLAVVVNVEAGVVVLDGCKVVVLEDGEGTGAEMLIGMLGDDEVEMDGDVAPSINGRRTALGRNGW